MSQRSRDDVGGTWARAAVLSIGFVALLWAIEVLDAVWSRDLDAYGVRPRDQDGLLGVVLAPVLHAGWDHLSGNTVPVLVLAFLVLVGGTGRGLAATAVIWLVGGFGVWLTAPTLSIHLGASVLVFGWLVYLIVRGAFTRSAGEIILGIVLFLAYGGLLLGVLPGQPGVSWQGHLFGAVGGALAAAWVDRRDHVARPRL
ncbi:rhomboid family intramembrane serine protease [Nocardioides abyssi]|uniref:Rhomboid family intramembrane serine protease n=1 Tax=Nocardioides abyssi TaxID=3058370 RepID=A0ABT8EWC9_9ACTN|nr:rhomboid family intramembrane serine protease [Nocardioides abyssi]MDN4162502.1 rhomboid family intramembrane serine protease [Nocardioides abyssi]